MSKSQNTKNEQQKDLCITSKQLTEQWRKGELPEGDYYISDGDEIYPDYYDRAEGFLKTYDYGVRRVIAEVPSYEEYEQLENWNRFTADYHALREAKEIAEYEKVELLEKVKQLKELLKEIRGKIKTIYDMDLKQFITSAAFTDDFVKKLDEVLNA